MIPKFAACLLGAICFSLSPAWSQQIPNAEKKRPTIGLALEGGGALGLAHVGLLEWLAQKHIPVDYIAGASMGGLVAGFYASGMTPSEMHQVVDTLDWNQLISVGSDDSKLSFRRKEDNRRLGDETVLGLRHKLILPAGLNSGQELDFLLSRVAAPYDKLPSFKRFADSFPLPSPPTLVSAKAHVFDKGSLAEALRATMSIPGLFDPVIDGKEEYVDGGLMDNLPVDLVKGMGADIVIAVYLATDPFNPARPQTLVDVLGRSLSAVIAAQERHNIEQADLLITIDLSGLSTGDFTDYSEMIQRGFAGAQKKETVLAKFRLNDPEWTEYLSQRQARRKTVVPSPAFIEVTGVDARTSDAIRANFVEDIGQPFSANDVQAQIEKVMGNGAFAYMAYDLIQRDGATGLAIHVRQSPSKPPTLQPALQVDGSDYRNSRLALAGRLTYANFGGFRSELRNDFTVGSTYSFTTEYYRPLSPLSNWFLAPRVFAYTRPLDFHRRSDILLIDREAGAGAAVDFGYEFGNTGEVRVGYEASHLATDYRLGDASLFPLVSGRYGAAHLSYSFNDVDDEVIPHSGVLGKTNLRWVDSNPGAPQSVPVFDGSVSYFQPLTKTFTGFVNAEGGTLFNRANTGVPMFYLGGPQRLSAYGSNELYGNEYLYGRVGYLKEIAVISTITNDNAYFLIDYEVGKMYGFPNSTRAPMDVNAGFLAKTVLGPLFVGGSVGDAGHRKWYFQMGRVFLRSDLRNRVALLGSPVKNCWLDTSVGDDALINARRCNSANGRFPARSPRSYNISSPRPSSSVRQSHFVTPPTLD